MGINEIFAEGKEEKKQKKQSETGIESVRKWRPKDGFFCKLIE